MAEVRPSSPPPRKNADAGAQIFLSQAGCAGDAQHVSASALHNAEAEARQLLPPLLKSVAAAVPMRQ